MKHAFLIMAHDNLPLLSRLVGRLDDPNSNIYIHVDKKSQQLVHAEDELKMQVKHSKVVFIPRIKVTWGGYSQIQCELNLRNSVKDKNEYYHFLSGHDYPLTDMRSFLEFFESNRGMEFIGFSRPGFAQEEKQRHSVYYFFQDMAGRDKNRILWWVNKGLVKVQLLAKIDWTEKYDDLQFEIGSNWVSITQPFA